MTHDGLSCGPPLPDAEYDELCRQAALDHFKWNVSGEGRSRLCRFALHLSRALFDELAGLALALDAEALEAERELLERTRSRSGLGLPLSLAAALSLARFDPGCRYARFDFHPVRGGGFAITEGNLDVASGFLEAGGVTELFAARVRAGSPAGDPASALAAALADRLDRGACVGVLHLTQFVDDHQIARYLARSFARAGLEAVHVSPSQLAWRNGYAMAHVDKARRLDAVFRFLPGDWFPRLGLGSRWWRAFAPGASLWVNPLTALLTQSKRFPLVWPSLAAPLPTWRRLLPPTRHPGGRDRANWVLKPAFGYEGERVCIEGVTDEPTREGAWREAWRRPSRWVEQQRLDAVPLSTPDGPRFPCIGVFVVDRRVAGLYSRLSEKPLIDQDAQDAVVLLDDTP